MAAPEDNQPEKLRIESNNVKSAIGRLREKREQKEADGPGNTIDADDLFANLNDEREEREAVYQKQGEALEVNNSFADDED